MKPRIALFGKHSTRTPFAYKTYRKIASSYLDFVDINDDPQLIATGFSKDYFDALKDGFEDLPCVKNAKLLVISEEPLWDTIYSPSYQYDIADNAAILKGSDLGFQFFNHMNSNLFDFTSVPYYLTTSTKYLARYSVLIDSVLASGGPVFLMKSNPISIFGMFEKRNEPWFEYDKDGTRCLCLYRTLLGDRLKSYARISGKGQAAASVNPRQSHPDWHLDKLAQSYMNYSHAIALENTCQCNYVTEKIFDAYATGSLPIYYAPVDHSVRTRLGLTSFFNVSGLDPNEAALQIISQNHNFAERADRFFDDIIIIAQTVLNPINFWDEVKVRSDKLLGIVLKALG